MKRVIADLQVHSKHSRATSKNLSIENLEKYGKIKGLNVIGTGDFQHPFHKKEIDQKLNEDDKGILWTDNKEIGFIWQTEISLMYSKGGKRRALHLLVFAPNKKIAEKIIVYLENKGRLDYDGRPIFGIDSRQFVKDLKEIEDKIEIIPAHCMTPWFGLFGSKSGFDSVKECFEDQSKEIYAVESGISADPEMLWRFEEIASGKINIVSFSDAHSHWPFRLGREATIFESKNEEISYDVMIKAIRTGEGLVGTIETPPEYGKYHWDGHRNCNFSCPPDKTKELKGICPICKNPLTIGVDNRVEEIAIKQKGFRPENAKKYYKIIPLQELIVFWNGGNLSSKKNWNVYNGLVEDFENEFKILLEVSREEMVKKNIDEQLIDLILKNREAKLEIKPGYDGNYGVPVIENLKSKN